LDAVNGPARIEARKVHSTVAPRALDAELDSRLHLGDHAKLRGHGREVVFGGKAGGDIDLGCYRLGPATAALAVAASTARTRIRVFIDASGPDDFER
jgi:hypothetical protein